MPDVFTFCVDPDIEEPPAPRAVSGGVSKQEWAWCVPCVGRLTQAAPGDGRRGHT
jgi:hypothetical protein